MSLLRILCPRGSRPTSLRTLLGTTQRPRVARDGHTTQSLSFIHPRHSLHKRQLQTLTGYQPQSLDLNIPPPRNTGIPDTSIASGAATSTEGDVAGQQTGRYISGESLKTNQLRMSESEGEAQKPRSTLASEEAHRPLRPTASTLRAQLRSKLRPRKAAMALTPSATNQLRQLLSQPDPKLIRVGVKNRGCSGLAYHLEYVDKPGPFDEKVEQDGVQVLIDSKALFSIIGSEMDWVEDKLSSRFVFRNPNISKHPSSRT